MSSEEVTIKKEKEKENEHKKKPEGAINEKSEIEQLFSFGDSDNETETVRCPYYRAVVVCRISTIAILPTSLTHLFLA